MFKISYSWPSTSRSSLYRVIVATISKIGWTRKTAFLSTFRWISKIWRIVLVRCAILDFFRLWKLALSNFNAWWKTLFFNISSLLWRATTRDKFVIWAGLNFVSYWPVINCWWPLRPLFTRPFFSGSAPTHQIEANIGKICSITSISL